MTWKQQLNQWLTEGQKLLSKIDDLTIDSQIEIETLLQLLLIKIKPRANRVFIIVNVGIHPIVEDLKRQFGDDIHYEVVTQGNVELNQEAQVARRVKEIVQKHHGAEFVIVPSALPYLITVVYNTVLQITSKHPVYLQLDREKNRYVEKNLDPRKLIV